MRILHRYVLASHLASLGMILLVFTFVLLLGNIFKDLMALLGNRSVGLFTIGKFFLMLMPYILSFTMPMALLAATLLVMGRISADNELTASRACGVSFLEIALPMLGVGAGLTFVCLCVNNWLAPRTRYHFNQAVVEVAMRQPIALLEEGQYIRDFDNMEIFIGKRDIRRGIIRDVRVLLLKSGKHQDIYAEEGTVVSEPRRLVVRITLKNARIDSWDPADPANIRERRWKMTVAEYPLEELDLTRLVDQRRAVKEIHHYTTRDLWAQVMELQRQGIHPTPLLVEIHKRIALAVACFSFVLLALPLGVQVQRRETSIGVLISLPLAVLYYFLIIYATGFQDRPRLYPELIIWAPNLVFQAIGLILLWRQGKA